MISTSRPTVGFVGLSHLGIVSSIAAAMRGFSVIGFDPDETVTNRLNAGDLIVSEPGLADAYSELHERIQYTSDWDSLKDCAVVYLSRDTVVDEETGMGLTDEIEGLVIRADEQLSSQAVLVVLSQVRPGFMRSIQSLSRPLYHQVETLIFGRALDRAVNPERIIVGCADTAEPLPPALATYLASFECEVIRMQYESSEVAKIAINCMLAASVSTTNVLAEVCADVGADWQEVRTALQSDKRIGQHAYLSPGLGIAGGNLERDLAAVSNLAVQSAVNVDFVDAMRTDSRYRLDWAVRIFREHILPIAPNPKIAVLGVAYKQDTHSTKNSPSLHFLSQIGAVETAVYDPVAEISAGDFPHVKVMNTATDVFTGANAVFVMTPWDEFRSIPLKDVTPRMADRIVVDPYRILNEECCRAHADAYFTLGNQGFKSKR